MKPDYFCFVLAFEISAVVRRSDGTNSPLTVSCDTTLDQLRIDVGEKLGRFPGLVALQYRLGSDNPKVGAISIQTNNELQLFIDRLRKLIVPPRLANGKASTRTQKPVLVYFEDSSSSNTQKETVASNVGPRKVKYTLYA